MIVGENKKSGGCHPISVLAAVILIASGWVSPVAGAGQTPSNDNLAKAKATTQFSEDANSAGSNNYGGMVVVGIIAVLTAVVGAAIWRAHELGVHRDLAIEGENQAVAARKGAEDMINHLLDQLRDRLESLGHLDIVDDAQRMVDAYHERFGFSQQDPEGLSRWAALLQNQGDRLLAQGDMNGPKLNMGVRWKSAGN
jgi:hypothetical protein